MPDLADETICGIQDLANRYEDSELNVGVQNPPTYYAVYS